MKKKLLLLSFLLAFFGFVRAQNTTERKGGTEQFSIYPNPASDFISVSNDDNLRSIILYNIVGRKIRQFDIEHSGAQYDIKDLPDGLYSVHLINRNNKVICTQRLSVR